MGGLHLVVAKSYVDAHTS